MLIKRILSKNVISVSVPGNRYTALDLMKKENVSVVPVTKGDTNKVIGILTRSDLINNPDEEQIALLMSRDLITAKADEEVSVVAKRMLDHNIRRVPVVNDDDELVGIVTSFDLINQALANLDLNIPVERYMITTVPTTWDESPLNVAFESMKFFGLKSILALNSNCKLTGILTETDFIAESEIISERTEHSSTVGTEGDKWSWDSTSILYIEKNRLQFTDKLVKDVATREVATANSKTKVTDCAKKMKQENIEQIPVTDVDGEILGLVRASDLMYALIDEE